jgi:short-subunit dehydrogenase
MDHHGQTTLITGASSGIGVEFARALAARGSNLVLVARRRDRLEDLARELRKQHGITATPIAMDLSLPGAGPALEAALDEHGLAITSLINNAGFGTTGQFHEVDPDRLTAEITLNVTSLVSITRTFIERLRAHGDGVLVNVASMAAYQGNPSMAVYGATKAFVLNFTEALWYESRGTGLRVLVLSPGATETEFFDVAGEKGHTGPRMSAERVVRTALDALDRRNPPPGVIAGRVNRASAVASRLISRKRMTMAIGAMMSR